jgi:hypothetical protein
MAHLGECFCYDCLAKKHQNLQLGLKMDMHRRVTKKRMDTKDHRNRVIEARRRILAGRAIKSDSVKAALGEGSWTPNFVS